MPSPSSAQDTTTARDTTIARADSIAIAPADSLAARRDSAVVDSTTPRPAPRPAVAVDSLLATACGETGGATPDLVVVTFRPATTAAEREAVAREVGGTVSGPSEHSPDSWYLRVPGSAGNGSVADRLIRLSPVLEVGATRCTF